MKRVFKTWSWVGLLLIGFCASSGLADGFRNPPEGASALGRAGMRLTELDDLSAVTHNPANLAEVEAAGVMPTVTLGYNKVKYTSPTGVSQETKDAWRALPAVYAAWPLADSQCVIGLGVNLPYGQFTRWDKEGILKGITPYFAQMTTVNISPVLAGRYGERLFWGIGPDIVWSELEFRQMFPFSVLAGDPMVPDGILQAKGDGYAIGGHAGLTYLLSDRQRLALVYRSSYSVDYEGDFAIKGGLPAALLPPPLSGSSDFDATSEFPNMVALGYGLQATETVRVEVNVEWIEHSRNETLEVDVANNNVLLNSPAVPNPMAPVVFPQDWDDTWTFGIGADWQVAPEWTLRAGWTYLPTPVPEETIMPTLAESDKNVVSLGLGFVGESHRLDVAYAYNFTSDRTVDDPRNPIQGEYEFDAHLFGLSYQCSF